MALFTIPNRPSRDVDNGVVKKASTKAKTANTVKGKGVSFMENNNAWHHGHLTEEQYKQALEELN